MRGGNALRLMYRFFDRTVWSRFSLPAQRRTKGAVLSAIRRLLPARAPQFSTEALLTDPRRHNPGLRGLPEWARADMADAALNVAPELNPDLFVARGPQWATAPIYRTDAGKAFVALRRQLPSELDTLFLVPWLTRGGADLGTLHYVRACVEEFGHSVAVIATEPQPSPWASRLPDNVPFIEAGHVLAGLDSLRSEQIAVLGRLLLQARPKRIHIVNSRLGWQVVQRHAGALRGFARLHASLFCDEYDAGGFAVGLAVDYLRDTASSLDSVICDNARIPEQWVRTHGVNPALFKVVHFPVERPTSPVHAGSQSVTRPRLLWASRLTRQKRPDILLEIARRLPEVDIDVHGVTADVHGFPLMSALRRQPNIHLNGPFQGVGEVAGRQHSAFLYTTEWDGLPNVLLEASALGLPIIAPDVGGISDLLAVEDLIATEGDMVGAYVRRIQLLLADPGEMRAQVERQATALQRHSWPQFVQALAGTPYYTDAPAGGRSGGGACARGDTLTAS